MSIFKKFFGDPNKKALEKINPIVEQVNSFEGDVKKLSDDELKKRTNHFKKEIKEGKKLDDLLPEVFATVREASVRTTGMRHYDVQILGGVVLNQGNITEMKTGEGKTLVATLPVYLNALVEKGVHVVTVNDYLAKRDTVWMGQVYHFLGLSVGCIQHESGYIYDPSYTGEEDDEGSERDKERDEEGGFNVKESYLRPVGRKEAYAADITYGTNNEFGFDYLRDNMAADIDQMAQRGHYYSIVDEVDSILIDEARTPLIISAPAEESTNQYNQFASIVPRLKENADYNIDEKMKATTLTEDGIKKLEGILNVKNIYEEKGIETVHHIEQALKAHTLFQRDKDYVVKGNEVVIVDEFTGRLMPGRRYSEGLHQAIEAKEGVEIKRESRTMATITFQNYFRMYKKLAGMTGTAATSAEEFANVYELDVVVMPTNKPLGRVDLNDQIFKSELGKFKAIAKEIKKRHEKGQPVLIGTVSIEKNELLSQVLEKNGVPHEVLNAKNHEKEGAIIAQAGKLGGVTVATNMAGRGVDIVLGGNPVDEKEAEAVKKVGGLYVVGTERHEARRIDNQLRGRAGRQGDPGESQFFVSMEDDVLRLFGSDRMKTIMETLRFPEDQPIEHKIISRSIESAQNKVEGNHFDMRKHVLEYDDVMNKHREVVYGKRINVLKAWENEKAKFEEKEGKYKVKKLKDMIKEMISAEIENIISHHTSAEQRDDWNIEEVSESLNTIYNSPENERIDIGNIMSDDKHEAKDIKTRNKIINYVISLSDKYYDQKEKKLGYQNMRQIERLVYLRAIDSLWVEHLDTITRLREGIGLRGYGQKDPLVEYKKESFFLFQNLLDAIQKQVVNTIYKIDIANREQSTIEKAADKMQFSGAKKSNEQQSSAPIIKNKKAGRNDPCPCGSGKKYKKCCGQES